MISASQAHAIQSAHERYERARERFDPKRYKRGGGYMPSEIAEIERLAGCKQPTNRARGALELWRFVAHPPDTLFAYYDASFRHVTTFMGDVIGTIVSKGKETRPMGGRVVSVRVRGINGVTYVGTCNLSSGTYCRLRRAKSA